MCDYSYSAGMEEFEALFSGSLLMSLFSAIPSMVISLAVFVVTAIGIYSIAKRRGINKPWLAFIPLVNVWTLGCIADQYRHITLGQIKARRKVLLGTNIALVAISVVVLVLCGTLLARIIVNIDQLELMNDDQAAAFVMEMMAPILGMVLLYLPLLVLTIVRTVFYYIALYDLYKSCEPSNAVLYLVLSIVISICQPIFLMVCRNKDDGMVPPYAPPQPPYGYNQPVWQSAQPQPPMPTWQPVHPAAEPWEEKE